MTTDIRKIWYSNFAPSSKLSENTQPIQDKLPHAMQRNSRMVRFPLRILPADTLAGPEHEPPDVTLCSDTVAS